jgi:hypothetical protein
MRCVAAPAIQQRSLQDAEIGDGEVSWCALRRHRKLSQFVFLKKGP